MRRAIPVSDVDSPKYPVNSDLKKYAEKFWKGELKVENVSLVLDRAPPFVKDEKEGCYKSSLSSVNKIFRNVKAFEAFLNNLIRGGLDEYERYFEAYTDFVGSIPKPQLIRLITRSRLVVGLGDESVYETSIRLHRNYGVPYIPGSALKGVAKHYGIISLTKQMAKNAAEDFFKLAKKVQEALEAPAKDENDERTVEKVVREKLNTSTTDDVANEIKVLRKIFGTQKREGCVIFFDAFPTPEQLSEKPILELDIMNPHYQPYYQHGEIPGDWHDPRPILFLTVPAGIEFQFAIALSMASLMDKERKNETHKILEKTKLLVQSALKELGVGAKTAIGYGRFECRP